jgi:two-component system NtrC family response regulator
MEKLLIIEANRELRRQLKCGIGKEYDILLAADRKRGISLLKKHHPRVVTLDLILPRDENGPEEGFRCLDEILKTSPGAKVIVITENHERRNAIKAMQRGSYDFYQKPIDLETLKVIINRAFYLHHIEEENRKLHGTLEDKTSGLTGMVGQCPEILNVFSIIRKVAPSEVSVIILGESGTGKELVARAIHSLSLRKDGAFVPINCSAIPENLLESELFGHEKGAFTGAHTQVQGKVEYACRGTLFLDEIGELPHHLQTKLLRFLQEKSFQRVGGRKDIRVDARIISATNIDIAQAIQEGRFREDLYYRIGVVTINLPPLRERSADRMLLANLFLARFAEKFKKKIRGFCASSVDLLESHDWPGNVRELENRIQRAVIMSESSIIEPHDLGFAEKAGKERVIFQNGTTLKEVRDGVERELVISVIKRYGGNIARAADELDISRPTLYDLMRKHGLYDLHNRRSKNMG